jgi:nucleoside-diphosphate-sugar epimerase
VSRVLVTGGAGAIGAAVVRRLLADPEYEVRVADVQPVPQWMREGCEVHVADLREPGQALAASTGCQTVVHLAGVTGGHETVRAQPYTLLDAGVALDGALVRAAVELQIERLVYVSCGAVFERAELFPTPEEHLLDCAMPRSALGRSKLYGELLCRSAYEEHGLAFTICRPCDVYGRGRLAASEPGAARLVDDLIDAVVSGRRPLPLRDWGERTLAPTHVADVADGIVAAMSSTAGVNEDFNICLAQELTIEQIARLAWQAIGDDPDEHELEQLRSADGQKRRCWPSAEKAQRLLGWEAAIEPAEGIASTVAWLRGLRVGGGL